MSRIALNKAMNHQKIPTSISLMVGFLMGVVVVMILWDGNHPADAFALLEDAATQRNFKEDKEMRAGGNSHLLAYRDSGGFFNDISDAHWTRMKRRVQTRLNHMHPEDPTVNMDAPSGWYQENFEPDFTCIHERRIGGMGDGPKWVCDPYRLGQKKDCLIYSVGSEGNFMFENAIMNEIGKHCEIHTFDPELQGVPYGDLAPKEVHYHNWGFVSENKDDLQTDYWDTIEAEASYKTMKETIETLGHVGREIDIFKIDCEGCEWTTYPDWFHSGATIRQILVEVHGTPENKVNDFFTGMQDNGYVTFHKEPNIQYAQGGCVEYAFLKLEESFFRK